MKIMIKEEEITLRIAIKHKQKLFCVKPIITYVMGDDIFFFSKCVYNNMLRNKTRG